MEQKVVIKNNWDKVLIIEDDFQFNDNINFKEIINQINNLLQIIVIIWNYQIIKIIKEFNYIV